MLGLGLHRRLQLLETPHEAQVRDLARAVRDGLTATPKTLPFRFLYDAEGSHLFERICEQPEYYLTRGEMQILEESAAEVVALVPEPAFVVELGSGSSVKTRLLLEALFRRRSRLRYMPIDISRTALREAAEGLLRDYPRLEVTGVAAEYAEGLREAARHDHPQLIVWLGSNIGNFTRTEAAAFLGGMHAGLGPDDRVLVGIDTCRDPAVLLQAYDDRAGVTAAFDKNLLARINRELGGQFPLASFRHEASWDEEASRVEMALVSLVEQTVRIEALDLEVHLRAGESIHTEWSCKYARRDIDLLMRAAGFDVVQRWFDGAGRMSLNLLAPR